MRAPISVVIPTLNAQSALETTLGPVYEGVQAGLLHELILSDGGSTDDTAKIADAAGAVWVTGSPSRGGQIARGIAAAQADWILILHADTILPVGWAGMCHAHMTRGQAGILICTLIIGVSWPALWSVGCGLDRARWACPMGIKRSLCRVRCCKTLVAIQSCP